MKILFTGDASSIHIKKWIDYFLQRKYEIEVISFLPAKIEGAKVHWINAGRVSPYKTNIKYLLKLPKIAKLKSKIKPDIVIAHYATSYGFISSLLFSKFILVVHGTDIKVTSKRNILFRFLTQFVLKRAALIFSVAQHMSDDIIKMGIPSDKIFTIQYGVDRTKFFKDQKNKYQYHCISTRSLRKNSNIDKIIKAISILKSQNKNIKLLIVGDGPEREYLKNLVNELEIGENVTFTGNISQEELSQFLRQSEIYISMTNSDGSSLSLLEAMISGNIPLVSDNAANREWINDGENGFIISKNEKNIANKINNILNMDRAKKEAIIKKASATVMEKGIYQKNMPLIEENILKTFKLRS